MNIITIILVALAIAIPIAAMILILSLKINGIIERRHAKRAVPKDDTEERRQWRDSMADRQLASMQRLHDAYYEYYISKGIPSNVADDIANAQSFVVFRR